MRLGLALSNEGPLRETIALARRAEELGLAEVWVPESSHGRSATSVVATLAAHTQRVGLGVGVVNPFWRHPSLIAMEAATLDEAAEGRLRIGLGAGLWTLKALGEADQRTRRPLAAMVEAIQVVRAMLRGRAAVRQVLAYYLWRVEGVVVERAGADPDAVADVRRTVAAQGVRAGAARVSDDLVEVFAAAGDPEQVVRRLRRYAEAGLDAALAWHVLGPDPDEGLRLLASAAPGLLSKGREPTTRSP